MCVCVCVKLCCVHIVAYGVPHRRPPLSRCVCVCLMGAQAEENTPGIIMLRRAALLVLGEQPLLTTLCMRFIVQCAQATSSFFLTVKSGSARAAAS